MVNGDMAIKLKLNNAGVTELFTSREMQAFLKQVADEIAGAASQMSGHEYDGNTKVLRNTAIGYVTARGYAARKDALENNTPLKAVGSLPTGKPSGVGLTKQLENIIEKELSK